MPHSVKHTFLLKKKKCLFGFFVCLFFSLFGSYNIVIFGGIDGFSRKVSTVVNANAQMFGCLINALIILQIMYLGAASNNLSATTLYFFQGAVEEFGFPFSLMFFCFVYPPQFHIHSICFIH